jgi:hypothetical protein
MQLVEDQVTKKGDRVGDRPVKAITPRAADRLYARIVEGPRGQRFRQGEKVIALCRHAWNVVHRRYSDEFSWDVPNPWAGVTRQQPTNGDQAGSDTRAGLYVRMRGDRGWTPGGRAGGGDFRMAAAPLKMC